MKQKSRLNHIKIHLAITAYLIRTGSTVSSSVSLRLCATPRSTLDDNGVSTWSTGDGLVDGPFLLDDRFLRWRLTNVVCWPPCNSHVSKCPLQHFLVVDVATGVWSPASEQYGRGNFISLLFGSISTPGDGLFFGFRHRLRFFFGFTTGSTLVTGSTLATGSTARFFLRLGIIFLPLHKWADEQIPNRMLSITNAMHNTMLCSIPIMTHVLSCIVSNFFVLSQTVRVYMYEQYNTMLRAEYRQFTVKCAFRFCVSRLFEWVIYTKRVICSSCVNLCALAPLAMWQRVIASISTQSHTITVLIVVVVVFYAIVHCHCMETNASNTNQNRIHNKQPKLLKPYEY